MLNRLVMEVLSLTAQSYIFRQARENAWWTSEFAKLRERLVLSIADSEELHQFYSLFCCFLYSHRQSGDAVKLLRSAAANYLRETVYVKVAIFSWLYDNGFISAALLTPERVDYLHKLEWLWNYNDEMFTRHAHSDLSEDLLFFQAYLHEAEIYVSQLLEQMGNIFQYQSYAHNPQNSYALLYLSENLIIAIQDFRFKADSLQHCIQQLKKLLPGNRDF